MNATINTEKGSMQLTLKLDRDNQYRWYDAEGNDTEVSGTTEADAVAQAESAWREWGITFAITDDLRSELVAMVVAANPISPEQVCDLVLDAAERGGREAGIAELERAKALDAKTESFDLS